MKDRAHQAGNGSAPSGGLAALVSESVAPSFRQSFPPETCAKVVVLAGLFAWLNFWQFRVLFRTWIVDANWSHGFLIPLFSVYFLYSRRDELFAAPRRTCLWGLPILLAGIVQVLVGVYPLQNYWISHLGMVPMILGLVLYLAGPAVVRVTWLPIVFLIFAMPISTSLYGQVALPLQNLAAAASKVVLRVFGVTVSVKGSSLDLVSVSGVRRPLTVAEACSGMRMLMAFLALGVATAYLDDRPNWQRVILVLMGVPIAVFCNIGRVLITSTMFYLDHPELGQDFMHSFTGMLMLAPAMLMLWGLSWLLRHLFVEAEDEPDEPDQSGGQAAGTESATT